jgi:hypothetical protein
MMNDLFMPDDASLSAFLSRLPSLVSLSFIIEPSASSDLFPLIASTCPKLTSLTISLPPHFDLLALSSLPLTHLSIIPLGHEDTISDECLRNITEIRTLTELSLRFCVAAFTEAGARLLARLPSLTKLNLTQRSESVIEEQALRAWASIPTLTTLHLISVNLPGTFGSAFAEYPHLSTLYLDHCGGLSDSSLATLFLLSSSLTNITVETGMSDPHEFDTLLPYLPHNTHILDTNLFPPSAHKQQHQHESRNRRLLHNWQCSCVLLASYRANEASVIRDSMLSLMHDVMSFLVPADWEVVRARA